MKTILIPDDVAKAIEEVSARVHEPKSKVLEDAMTLYIEYRLQNPIGPPLTTEEAIQEIVRYFTQTYHTQVSRCI